MRPPRPPRPPPRSLAGAPKRHSRVAPLATLALASCRWPVAWQKRGSGSGPLPQKLYSNEIKFMIRRDGAPLGTSRNNLEGKRESVKGCLRGQVNAASLVAMSVLSAAKKTQMEIYHSRILLDRLLHTPLHLEKEGSQREGGLCSFRVLADDLSCVFPLHNAVSSSSPRNRFLAMRRSRQILT